MGSLRRRLPGDAVGSSVGAAFGGVFVFATAGELGRLADMSLRLVALLVFGVCMAGVIRSSRRARAPRPARFGRHYWAVVAAEVTLILAGRYVLVVILDRPEAVLPWVTVVVGVHFFPLAVVLRARIDHLVGLALTGCGLAGLVLSFTADDAAMPTALIAGVCPGFVLLGASLWGLRHPVPQPTTVAKTAARGPSDEREQESEANY
ncbi:MAG: hypothetical protein ACTHKG_04660 [Nocardioides sp.]